MVHVAMVLLNMGNLIVGTVVNVVQLRAMRKKVAARKVTR
jgi:hypothetical protein